MGLRLLSERFYYLCSSAGSSLNLGHFSIIVNEGVYLLLLLSIVKSTTV